MSGKGWYCSITICPFVVKLLDTMLLLLLFFNATDPLVKSSSVTGATSDCAGRTQSVNSKSMMVSPDVIVPEECFFIVVSLSGQEPRVKLGLEATR
jgi:hypothetical protein